jgi:hypothetical protein
MNLPNGAQLIHYAPKRQAVINEYDLSHFKAFKSDIHWGLSRRNLQRENQCWFSPPSQACFGAAAFAFRYAASKGWCQRLESNQ